MTDALLTLGAYGFLVRAIVEFIQGVFHISGAAQPMVVRGIAVVVSAAFVYGIGINPVALLGMGKLKVLLEGVAIQPIGIALLAGASMSTNDILDLIVRMGRK